MKIYQTRIIEVEGQKCDKYQKDSAAGAVRDTPLHFFHRRERREGMRDARLETLTSTTTEYSSIHFTLFMDSAKVTCNH
jgi:hypothetical protein